MLSLVAVVLFIVLASSGASKYPHPFHHYQQDKEPYPPDSAESNEGESEGMLAKLAARLRSVGDEDAWEPLPDPRMYVLTELESPGALPNPFQHLYQEDLRRKRPSLSIVNPFEVLQEKYQIGRNRKIKEGLIERNRQLLTSIGKRSVPSAGESAPLPQSTSNEITHRFLPYSYQT